MTEEDILKTQVKKSRNMALYHQLEVMKHEIFLYKLQFPKADPRNEEIFKMFYHPDFESEPEIKNEQPEINDDDLKNLKFAREFLGR